jgi:anthranilate synthase component 1
MITRDEAVAQLGRGRAVALVRELSADLLTPVGALLRLLAARDAEGDGADAFLFESVERGERVGRYSYVGVAPPGGATDGAATLVGAVRAACEPPLVAPLESGAQPPPFLGGVVFALGWELVRHIEPRLGAARGAAGRVGHFPTVVAFDHLRQSVLLAHVLAPPGGAVDAALAERLRASYDAACDALTATETALRLPLPGLSAGPIDGASGRAEAAPEASPSLSDEAFAAAVGRAREYVVAGDVFQVVLSRRFARPVAAGGLDIYRALRTVNPSPYMFYLRLGGEELMGASPELLCRVHEGVVTTHPIAGTRRRGSSDVEDAELARELLADPKERAEHAMLVDLARNDLGRVAERGTVRITRHMEVERFSHVMHLVSEVQGSLAPGLDPVDALLACFPAGTVSGAPKVRAMEIIDELEPRGRGPYAGAIGAAGPGGHLDSCIAIRTVHLHEGTVSWQAGAGIVYDSVPEREVAETLAKAGAMARAVTQAERAVASGGGEG